MSPLVVSLVLGVDGDRSSGLPDDQVRCDGSSVLAVDRDERRVAFLRLYLDVCAFVRKFDQPLDEPLE